MLCEVGESLKRNLSDAMPTATAEREVPVSSAYRFRTVRSFRADARSQEGPIAHNRKVLPLSTARNDGQRVAPPSRAR